ncbi:MAG: 4-hydroxybenzoate octaprenyltransferase [Gammaproteobacteria bacterium]|nr:MAG: 4-hydroxybenzoate octaprenyltransferase [Gammaproteobacteria bacterium]
MERYRVQKLLPYIRLMRLDKPIGILLLLWPTLWGLVLAANSKHDLKIILIFCVGVVIMRSAGCVINDIADRKFDAKVKRTKQRPLVSGELNVKHALVVFCVLVALAFILVVQLNLTTVLMSIVAILLAISYPFAKRITNLPQAHLGVAFAWAIPMAYTAYDLQPNLVCWLLFCATAMWALIYDTIYAMVDRDDDLKIGVKSSAILFGKYDILVIAILQVIFITLLSVIGMVAQLGIGYFLSLAVVVVFFMHHLKMIWLRERDPCFKAFLNNHWIGVVVLIGVVVS